MADQEQTTEFTAEIDANVDAIVADLMNDGATERPRDTTGKFVARNESEPSPEEEPNGNDALEEEDDAAPEGASDEEEQEQEPETAIDPPASWTADAKEAFSKLPPELQHYVAERESDRERGINAKLSEAADARKKYETEATSTAQERQRYADTLKSMYQLQALIDPVLADGNQTDWLALSKADPAGYVAKRAEYEQRLQLLNAVQGEIQQVTQRQANETKANYAKRLSEEFPEFASPETGKALRESYAPTLKAVGFTAEEIEQGWGLMHEPKYLKILDKAAKFDKLQAERKTIGDKKVVQQPGKVVKPRAADTANKGRSAPIVALEKRANTSGRDTDRADYLLAELLNGKSR